MSKSNSNPRKRAAPGATPMTPRDPQIPQPYAAPNMTSDQMVRWNGGDGMGGYVDGPAAPGNSFELVQSQRQFPQNLAAPTNSLTRRPMNRSLVPDGAAHGGFDPSAPWAGFIDDASLVPLHQDDPAANPSEDNIEELEERAQKAKREALSKRKQIPPFVQKLSSFLEEGKNEDLIRWSQKGDSFIVLDEDEFAKTLIPELFKHNNYASFVRQLNMYGFHKRVGLSDNSMRASERKNKSPSEYSNPYFRRGHPNLLWLINKPKGGGKGGKKASKPEEADSDEETGHDDAHGPAHGTANTNAPKALPAAGEGALRAKEVALIRDELKQVREQQKLISRTISHLQQNNRDLYNQAVMFQTQHDRHQNSINAILHFLANLFRKSLEEQGNTQSAGDILSSILANQGQPATHQGTVVDLGDFFQNAADPSTALTPHHQRTRGLLPPIPDASSSGSTSRPSRASSAGFGRVQETGQVTELGDGTTGETPPSLRQELENNPQERMMRIINDHNATNSLGMDLPDAADFVVNAPNSLNSDQRDQLANLMSRQSATPSTRQSSTTPKPGSTQYKPSMSPPSAVPSDTGGAPPTTTAPSLSPIMRSPAMPPLSMNQISSNQDELERLQELQAQQGNRINELSEMLGPLSPSGRIPPLDEAAAGGDNYFDPQNVDLDQYFDSTAFLDDSALGVNFDGTTGDVGLDAGLGANGVDEPSPAEDIPRDDGFGMTDNKRRRME